MLFRSRSLSVAQGGNRKDRGQMAVQAVRGKKRRLLSADDDTLAAGGLLLVHVLVFGGAVRRIIGISAACTTAVKLDAVTSAGDAVAFARAA